MKRLILVLAALTLGATATFAASSPTSPAPANVETVMPGLYAYCHRGNLIYIIGYVGLLGTRPTIQQISVVPLGCRR